MRIEFVVCPNHIEEKLQKKHGVTCYEAQGVLFNKPRFRFAERGRTKDNDVYVAFGRTFGGRYLSVFSSTSPKIEQR